MTSTVCLKLLFLSLFLNLSGFRVNHPDWRGHQIRLNSLDSDNFVENVGHVVEPRQVLDGLVFHLQNEIFITFRREAGPEDAGDYLGKRTNLREHQGLGLHLVVVGFLQTSFADDGRHVGESSGLFRRRRRTSGGLAEFPGIPGTFCDFCNKQTILQTCRKLNRSRRGFLAKFLNSLEQCRVLIKLLDSDNFNKCAITFQCMVYWCEIMFAAILRQIKENYFVLCAQH